MARKNFIGSMKVKDVILLDENAGFSDEFAEHIVHILQRPVILVPRLGSIKSLTKKEWNRVKHLLT